MILKLQLYWASGMTSDRGTEDTRISLTGMATWNSTHKVFSYPVQVAVDLPM